MATVYKILGQSAPAANTNTVLYTAPALTQSEGKLVICNRGGKPARIFVANTVSGGTLGNKDYLCFDKPLAVGETITVEGLVLGAADFITVAANKSTVSFNLLGSETA